MESILKIATGVALGLIINSKILYPLLEKLEEEKETATTSTETEAAE